MTRRLRRVLGVFLADPARERTCLGVCEEAGLPPGTVYLQLVRLEARGWVGSRWDEGSFPRRRLYRLTREGELRAAHALKPGGRRVPAGRVCHG